MGQQNVKEWFQNSNYEMLFIRADGGLAGFIVIKYITDEDVYYLNHFFILRKFRRKSVGREAANQAFNLHGDY
ncbi:MAG: hypothetical protein K0Q73_3428 [Paenibacillus sp.]|jgi:predicted acetyltransferase|nr:hypothetical protein [Paenibacillus sp.]